MGSSAFWFRSAVKVAGFTKAHPSTFFVVSLAFSSQDQSVRSAKDRSLRSS